MHISPFETKNIADLLLARVKATPTVPAISYRQGETWQTLTWEDFGKQVRILAAGLLSLGLKKGHRVALYAPTSLHWILLDTAVLCIGAVSVAIHEKTPPLEAARLLTLTDTAFLYVSGQKVWEEILTEMHKIPSLQRVITLEKVMGDADVQLQFAELEQRGKQGLDRLKMQNTIGSEGDLLHNASLQVEPEREACIYFTSGTTGTPRPVSLTHQHLLSQIRSVYETFREEFKDKPVGLSMLPYSHIFGRVEWLCLLTFGARGYAAEGFENLPQYFQETSPTIIFTVPRVLETIRARILLRIQQLPAIKRKIAEKSFQEEGEEAGKLQSIIADKLVFSKIRELMGGNLQTIICAGAPLDPQIARFFHTLGLKVIEAYGLTETTGALAVTKGDPEQFGTVGKALPNCEIRLSQDAEILVRGPTVISQYGAAGAEQNLKDPEATAAFTEGWFFTGDLGAFDDHQNLTITGRKKDMIVTSAGKNIAPQKIENLFANDPIFDEVIVLGDQKPYLIALVVLDRKALKVYPEIAPCLTEANWSQNSLIQKLVQERIERVNENLASFETIKKFHVLPEPLSIENGELTFSLKPRRTFLAKKHAEIIQSLYMESLYPESMINE